ncbi:hypothetical protein NLM31_21060 [Bradyrhizobium sp. CCGUVB4N]|uniref:hypothetical protein n=1 Tax=Bradyrhizobium sp. CCGUVB4N TaxID=2949631 RepID=UPI0020B31AA6|nr:hypothetical protein [Bradyrhizobium sp. CCGUVB4N]MCP3382860.1 hypothetical protein [Bradyrhizobium sp. CCGUVB4N]
MTVHPIRFHEDAEVNDWVWLLLTIDFHPWRHRLRLATNEGEPVSMPLDLTAKDFGETLLAIADKFGDQAVFETNIWKH